MILREILNPLSDCSPVWIPDPEVEGVRDQARLRQDAVKATKPSKQKVASLLMPPLQMERENLDRQA